MNTPVGLCISLRVLVTSFSVVSGYSISLVCSFAELFSSAYEAASAFRAPFNTAGLSLFPGTTPYLNLAKKARLPVDLWTASYQLNRNSVYMLLCTDTAPGLFVLDYVKLKAL